MFANQRRTTSEVLKEILLSSPATKSNIRFSVGLNLRQAERYLPHLVGEGYLQLVTDDNGSTIYEISSKGKKLLEILSDLSEMTDVPDTLPSRRRLVESASSPAPGVRLGRRSEVVAGGHIN